MAKKEITADRKVAKDIMESAEKEFKGYTIEDIRFQRALVALEAEFAKTKFLKSWHNVQRLNPLSPTSQGSFAGKAGNIALKLVNGLNYMDYILLGISAFSGIRKVVSLFKRKK